jgi:hypothetical protein
MSCLASIPVPVHSSTPSGHVFVLPKTSRLASQLSRRDEAIYRHLRILRAENFSLLRKKRSQNNVLASRFSRPTYIHNHLIPSEVFEILFKNLF